MTTGSPYRLRFCGRLVSRKYSAKDPLDSKGREGLRKPVDVSEAPRQHRRVIAGCEYDGNVVGQKLVRQSEGGLIVQIKVVSLFRLTSRIAPASSSDSASARP